MNNETDTAISAKRVHRTRRSPHYWRVTFDHPPLNIFGPETIPQLNEIITALKTDKDVKVVVFDSAVEGFFLTHYDFLARPEDSTRLPPGPTGLQPLPDMLVRLSRARSSRSRQFAAGRRVSAVSLPWPATCVSRAARKPFCRSSKWEQVWYLAVAPWRGCRA